MNWTMKSRSEVAAYFENAPPPPSIPRAVSLSYPRAGRGKVTLRIQGRPNDPGRPRPECFCS